MTRDYGYSEAAGRVEQMDTGVLGELHPLHEALPRKISGKFSGPYAVQPRELAKLFRASGTVKGAERFRTNGKL